MALIKPMLSCLHNWSSCQSYQIFPADNMLVEKYYIFDIFAPGGLKLRLTVGKQLTLWVEKNN